jgi:cell division protein FtsQ
MTETLVRLPDADATTILRVDEARRRSLRRWAIAGAATLSIAVVGMGLTITPLFHARTIEVGGTHHLSERQVRRLAGVDAGTNVFSLDEGAVARRLERNAWILDATVTTSLPSTVQIDVTERTAVAVAHTDEGFVMLAEDGSVLGPAHGAGLPEIRALEAPEGQLEQPVTGSMVSTATRAAAGFGPSLRPEIEAIVVEPDGTLTLELRDGVTVTYGGSNDLEAKAEALRAILDYADRAGKELLSIDVETPAAPTARFVGVPATTFVPAPDAQGDRAPDEERPAASASASPSP